MSKSNVYTRTGDSGSSSLVGGTRVAKNNVRLEAYGSIDEANSWLGLLNASDSLPEGSNATLMRIMNHLFDIGAALATEPESKWQPAPFPSEAVEKLEAEIDAIDAELPRHNRFILPAGHPDAARANIARTVVRRAERQIVTLSETTAVDPNILHYINRLSDYLFVLGRAINFFNSCDEIFWDKSC
ncbi:MAG: cob(I)yrinic acid a,c-diamide adenosyltransferase [Muribaculaceae bacterium]|nr:cob(I)yrinic acid a,c-diamide adenosyltransferase [Muribaculaceae bacterium]